MKQSPLLEEDELEVVICAAYLGYVFLFTWNSNGRETFAHGAGGKPDIVCTKSCKKIEVISI
jgi:hypothetical protein